MCDEIYTVPIAKVLAMHKAILVFGLIPIFFFFLALSRAIRELRRTSTLEAPIPRWRRWSSVAGYLLLAAVASIYFGFFGAPVAKAARFTVDGREIQSVEIETVEFVEGRGSGVVQTTVLDDPADVCHLIQLLQEAPPHPNWQPATGTGYKYYRIRFVRADGSRLSRGLEAAPNGYREHGTNVVLLTVNNRDVGPLQSPAICEWVAIKTAGK